MGAFGEVVGGLEGEVFFVVPADGAAGDFLAVDFEDSGGGGGGEFVGVADVAFEADLVGAGVGDGEFTREGIFRGEGEAGVWGFPGGVFEVADPEGAGGDLGAVGVDDLADDVGGGGEVFLEEEGGEGEGVADVVETVAGVVGGEFFFDVVVDPEDFFDGVLIFDAIEPAGGDAAGVGCVAVDFEDVAFDPGADDGGVFGGGLGLVGGGHGLAAEIAPDVVPEVDIGGESFVVGEVVEGDAAAVCAVAVAFVAGVFEDGEDVLLVVEGDFSCGGGGVVCGVGGDEVGDGEEGRGENGKKAHEKITESLMGDLSLGRWVGMVMVLNWKLKIAAGVAVSLLGQGGVSASVEREWSEKDARLANRYMELLGRDPSVGRTLDLLWDLYEGAGAEGTLIEHFEAQAQANLVAQLVHGHLLRKAGRLTEARDIYAQVLAAAPGYPPAVEAAVGAAVEALDFDAAVGAAGGGGGLGGGVFF